MKQTVMILCVKSFIVHIEFSGSASFGPPLDQRSGMQGMMKHGLQTL